VPKGVYYRGALVGYERKYSDRLLVQLLKAHPPITLRGTDEDGAFCHENLARLTEEQVVDCTRVVRHALDYARRATEPPDAAPSAA
jgi:hypothetical protein